MTKTYEVAEDDDPDELFADDGDLAVAELFDEWEEERGLIYEGELKDDEMHGQGTAYYADGSMYDGEWKNGNPWNGTEYDEDGNVTGTWSHGELREK